MSNYAEIEDRLWDILYPLSEGDVTLEAAVGRAMACCPRKDYCDGAH